MDNVETYFLVVINKDGNLTTFSELPESLPAPSRKATSVDVYEASRQISEEFERDILTGRIVQTLLAALNPPQETVQDKLKDKLKERGINPESITPVE